MKLKVNLNDLTSDLTLIDGALREGTSEFEDESVPVFCCFAEDDS